MQAVTNVRHAQTTSSKVAWSVVSFRWPRVLLVFLGLNHWTVVGREALGLGVVAGSLFILRVCMAESGYAVC